MGLVAGDAYVHLLFVESLTVVHCTQEIVHVLGTVTFLQHDIEASPRYSTLHCIPTQRSGRFAAWASSTS